MAKDLDIKLKGFRDIYEFVSMFMKATKKPDPDEPNIEYSRYNPMNWLVYNGEKRWLKYIIDGKEPMDYNNRRLLTAIRYPRLTALVISYSLGYATPSLAAMILEDVKEGNENWCEWLHACWDKNPTKMLKQAIKQRHHYVKSTNCMDSYQRASMHVARYTNTGKENDFAAWF